MKPNGAETGAPSLYRMRCLLLLTLLHWAIVMLYCGATPHYIVDITET